MRIPRQIVIVVALMLAGGLVWFILKRGESQKSGHITVGIGTFSEAIDYGPVYVARHFGWFEDALKAVGVTQEVQYVELGSFDEIQTGFAQSKLHAFFSAEAPAIKLRSENQNIRVVEVGCTLQQEVLVRTELNITSIAQLRGKSIAVAEGTSSHYGLLKILSMAGLSATENAKGETRELRLPVPGFPCWAVWLCDRKDFVFPSITTNSG